MTECTIEANENIYIFIELKWLNKFHDFEPYV